MAEQKRQPAYLGSVPATGGSIHVSVSPEGIILLSGPEPPTWHLQEGPALVLGTMLQLAVQVAQAAKLRQIQALGTAGPPRA